MASNSPDFSTLPDLPLINILSQLDHESLLNSLLLNSRIKQLEESMRKEEFKNGIESLDVTIAGDTINNIPADEWIKDAPKKVRWVKPRHLIAIYFDDHILSKIGTFLCADLTEIRITEGSKGAAVVKEIKRIVANAPKIQFLELSIKFEKCQDYVDILNSVDCRAHRPNFQIWVPELKSTKILDAFLAMKMRCDRAMRGEIHCGIVDADNLEVVKDVALRFFQAMPEFEAAPANGEINATPPKIILRLKGVEDDHYEEIADYLEDKFENEFELPDSDSDSDSDDEALVVALQRDRDLAIRLFFEQEGEERWIRFGAAGADAEDSNDSDSDVSDDDSDDSDDSNDSNDSDDSNESDESDDDTLAGEYLHTRRDDEDLVIKLPKDGVVRKLEFFGNMCKNAAREPMEIKFD